MDFSFGGIDPRALIVVGVLALCLIAVVISFSSEPARARRRLKSRMHRVKDGGSGRPRRASPGISAKRRTQDSSFAQLDKLIKQIVPRPELLRERLARTGREISLGEYILINLVLTVLVAYAFHRLVEFSSVASSVLTGVAIGLGLPHFVVGFIINRRLNRFISLFPEAIDLIVRGLKSGLPVPESIKVVGEELADPLGVEFRQVAHAIKLGSTLDEALAAATKRLTVPEFKFFMIALAIQRETGGNLSETLENLSDILRKRRAMKGKIKAMSAEAKTSAMILGSLPFFLFGVIMLINPGYVTQLFTDPRGVLMVVLGLCSLGLGIAIMAKMIRFEI